MIPVVKRAVIEKARTDRPEAVAHLFRTAARVDARLKPEERSERSYVIEHTLWYYRLVHVKIEELRP